MKELTQKKIIIYILITVAVFALLILIFYQYLRSSGKTTPSGTPAVGGRISAPQETTTQGPVSTPEADGTSTSTPAQKLTRLTDFSTISPSLNPQEDRVFFYKKDGGALFSADFSGQIQEKISNLTIVGLLETIWSPKKDRGAVVYLDNDELKSFIHIGTSSWAVLPKDIKSLAWSPDGKTLAYLVADPTGTNLIVTDQTGKNPKTIFSTPLPASTINWPIKDKISFLTPPSGLTEGGLFVFSRADETFKKVLGLHFGLTTTWSPDGTKIAAASTDRKGKNPTLSIFDASGQELFASNLQTIPEKCVWAGNKILYCAVPKLLTPNWVWPDDYLSGSANTQDRLVRLDLDTKSSVVLSDFSDDPLDISSLVITQKQNWLFFVDRNTGALWVFKIN